MTDLAFTGIGVVSSLGVGRKAFWQGCREARSGIHRVTSFDTSAFRSNIGAEVRDFHPEEFMEPAVYRRMSPISRMAVAASIEALEDSGLELNGLDRDRVAVVMGTTYGSSSYADDFYLGVLRDGPRCAEPFLFPETVLNAPASHIAMVHRITGPNSTFCQNQISAEAALLYARNLLDQGVVDVALVGGAEELSSLLFLCYDALGALNRIKVEGDVPPAPVRGGGLILGEGAGVLVLERLDHAISRNAKVYGRLASGIITGGAAPIGHYEETGTQMGRAVLAALQIARLDPSEIDQIHVSANFTAELARLEHDQLKSIFAGRGDLDVSPLKYLIGDFGGAGMIRAAACLMSLLHQQPLPTVRIDAPGEDPGQTLAWQMHDSENLRAILMTSTTFGGGSSSFVFTKTDP